MSDSTYKVINTEIADEYVTPTVSNVSADEFVIPAVVVAAVVSGAVSGAVSAVVTKAIS